MSSKRKANNTLDAPNATYSNKVFIHLMALDYGDLQYLVRYGETRSYIFDDNGENSWRLQLEPFFSDDTGLCSTVEITLKLRSHEQPNVKAIFGVTVYSQSSWEIAKFETETPHDFVEESLFSGNYFLHGDSIVAEKGCSLFLLCRLDLVEDSMGLSSSESAVCGDLGQLFDSGEHSDVILALDGRDFKAHKAILSARSEVFAAMFKHDMMEKKLNRVTITDMKPDVVQEMLHFLYTGNSPNINEMAADLLAAADKYALAELKRMCAFVLIQSTNIETAVEILLLADHYNIDQLKANVVRFINLNATEVMATEEWKKLDKTDACLFREISEALESETKKKLKKSN